MRPAEHVTANVAASKDLESIGTAAKDVLKDIKVKKDPDTVLTELTKKIAQRSAIKDAPGGQRLLQRTDVKDLLETLAAQSCGRPKHFKERKLQQEKDRTQAELQAQQEDARRAKAEHDAQIKIQKHKDQSSTVIANINLATYCEKNLRLLCADHSGKLSADKTSMAASAYDPETQRYFVGRSGEGHRNANGFVPAAIWNSIKTEVDVTDDAFGTNCAEVDCLVKMFAARAAAGNGVQDLKGVVFVAYKVAASRCRGPCHSCKGRTRNHGATCLMPNL